MTNAEGGGAGASKALVVAKRGDAGRKRALDLFAYIQRRKARVVEDFFDIGQALHELQEKKLYAVLGYDNMRAMVEAEDLVSMTQATKLIAIARAYPREEALALGLERAYLLIRYAEVTPEVDSPRVLVETNAKIGRRPIRELPVSALKEATRAAQQRAKKADDPEERAARKAARELQARLRRRGAEHASVVAFRRGGAWELRVEIAVEHAALLE